MNPNPIPIESMAGRWELRKRVVAGGGGASGGEGVAVEAWSSVCDGPHFYRRRGSMVSPRCDWTAAASCLHAWRRGRSSSGGEHCSSTFLARCASRRWWLRSPANGGGDGGGDKPTVPILHPVRLRGRCTGVDL
jgi:hypothetical protein